MKNYKYLIWYIIIIFILLTVWYFLIDLVPKKFGLYLDSNLFQSIITFSVWMLWFLAYFIYKEQQKEKKEEIAKAIIFELREAEKNINDFKVLGGVITVDNKWIFYTKIKILSTNNWTNNIGMFIDILDEDDISILTSFYEGCEKLNRELLNIQNIKNLWILEKAKQIQRLKVDLLENIIINNDAKIEITQLYDVNNTIFLDKYKQYFFNKFLVPILFEEDIWFESYAPMKDFMVVINSLQLILNTPTGEKFKKIIKS